MFNDLYGDYHQCYILQSTTRTTCHPVVIYPCCSIRVYYAYRHNADFAVFLQVGGAEERTFLDR